MALKFPFEIFSRSIADSFQELADEYSLPPDYLGSTALFTLSALSGNMYQTELNGSIKNIIYSMLVGPTGTGKTPAYTHLCSNITGPLDAELFERHKREMKEWTDKKEEHRVAKTAFKDPVPRRRIRMATSGTMEGIMNHAMHSTAGFGMYYDEGGKMLGSPNAYKRDTSSIDFWNETWNGQPFNDLRADTEKERFVGGTSISVLIGMQTDRVEKYFTADSIESGLPFRFLITVSERQLLQENVDHFNLLRRKPCEDWVALVRKLYWKGATEFFKDTVPYSIPFTDSAKAAYNDFSRRLIQESNRQQIGQKKDGITSLMMKYDSKLYSYVGRFLLILAIMDDQNTPAITIEHVRKSELLYRYYRSQAQKLFTIMQDDDLSENERLLLDSLPDEEFCTEDIVHACEAIDLSEKFFYTAFRRKLRNGFVKRVSRGVYIKDV
jgi:Protein of unknown function (DUF3987)